MDEPTIEEPDTTNDASDALEAPEASELPYERLEEIGSGGVGTVYRGRQTRLDREVAIKELNNLFDIFADIRRDDIVDRFTKIARTQSTLSHPHIIQTFDLVPEAEYPYVVTEYAPNGNLRRLIESDEERSLELALKYFVQVLHGLNAAHKQGVVHGSINPENVVLDPAGNACLTDFGLSRLVDLSGISDQVYVGVGSVAYMPPEQIQNPTKASVQSDIYALGIMFYELLTGKVPGRRSPMPSSFYSEIPRSLDNIFDRMSMDVAEDRYDSIDAILVDFYETDEIVELLDKETGVVFLRDPIAAGDARFVESEGADADDGANIDSAEPSGISEPDDTSALPEETAHPGTAASGGDEAAPDALEETSDAELADDSSASELADDSSAAELADDSSASELADDSSASELADDSSATDEADAGDGDAEDDEVLDKLDEYGELFDE